MQMKAMTATNVSPVRLVRVHTTSHSMGTATIETHPDDEELVDLVGRPPPRDHELVAQLVEVLGGKEPLQQPHQVHAAAGARTRLAKGSLRSSSRLTTES